MGKNIKIDKQIKKSFESLENKAPSKIWNNLSMQLDADFDLDKKIKESFENKENKAPEHIWNKINRQLNIDNSWRIINIKLNRQIYFFFLKVAAVILMLLTVAHLERNSNSRYELISYHPIELKNLSKHKNNPSGIKQKLYGQQQKSQSVSKNNSPENLNNPNNLEHTDQTNIDKNKSNLLGNFRQTNIFRENTKNNHSNKNLLINKLPSKNPMITVNEYNISIDKNIPDTIFPDDYYFENIKPSRKYEIGLTYSLQNTWILNNDTKKSFDNNSLIRSQPSFTNNSGLLFSYYLNENNVITTDLYVLGKTKQQYEMYYEGRYYLRTIEFTFTQLAVLYQYDINQIHKIPTAYSIKMGIYFSKFTKKQFILNNDDSYHDDFSKFDYGLKFAIGHKNIIHRFTLEYGITSKYGIKNIFDGNKIEPSGFNRTHLFHFGGYLNFSYKF